MRDATTMGKRLAVFVVMALTICMVHGVSVEAALVGNAVITGKVTNTANQPIPGARVLVEVVGAFAPFGSTIGYGVIDYWSPRGFWGQHIVVLTDGTGSYSATVALPPDVPEKNRYARVAVAKVDGQNTYTMQSTSVALTGTSNTFQVNFKLARFTYGGYLTVIVRDQQTGERLPGIQVNIMGTGNYPTSIWNMNRDGELTGVVPLSAATEARTIVAGSNTVEGGSCQTTNGMGYIQQNRNMTLVSRKLQVVDIALPRDTANRVYVAGRVLDKLTGKPIPDALVLSDLAGPGPPHCSSVTDFLGRYQVSTNYPSTLTVKTNGAFLRTDDVTAPYQAQTIDLSGRLLSGEVFEQDISLVHK